MIQIREAQEGDAQQIRELFIAVYGQDYSHPQFYDLQSIKKMVYSDDTIILVAEDTVSGRVVGTGSVLLEMGAHSDLLGELGRLAVHPDARNRGVGKRLMEGRLQRMEDRLHLALVEPRAVHPFAQKISLSHGFAAVGFQPMKLLLDRRESLMVCVRYFGDSLKLRRSNPRVISEVYPLAELALHNCGLNCDAVVREVSAPYPREGDFELDELTAEGYTTLLHFQRGRVRRREIFGPVRLHHGLFNIRAHKSNYLLARDQGRIVGAVGFTVDEVEKTLRIFELVTQSDQPVVFLLAEVERSCGRQWDVDYIEVDVSAFAPRMQQTLLELGYLPAAYVPAMVFHQVERLDGIRMVRLLVAPQFGGLACLPEARPIVDLIRQGFVHRQVVPGISEAIPKITLFAGLDERQARDLTCRCTLNTYAPGDRLFSEHETGDAMFLILEGEVLIGSDGSSGPRGTVGPGECLGEISLLQQSPHSATATARTAVQAAVLGHADIDRIARLRPDIGVVIYRNLAAGLGRKLTGCDRC